MFPRIPKAWRDSDVNMTLQDLNDILVGLHTPSIVFISVLMVMGVVGNILSIYVFTTRYESSTHRYFILFMAWIDLVACAVGKPLLLVSMIQPYMFPSNVICKIGRFLHINTVVASALIVVAIASERHRRICSPFSLELSSKRTLIICVLATVFGSLTAIPAVMVYGMAPVSTGYRNETGSECFLITEYEGTIWPSLYFLFQLVLAFTCTIALAIMYSKTGVTLWIHLKFRTQNTYQHQRLNKEVKDKPVKEDVKQNRSTLRVENDVCHSISTRSDGIQVIQTPRELVLTKPYIQEDSETAINGATEAGEKDKDTENQLTPDFHKPERVSFNVPETVPEEDSVVVNNEEISIHVPKIETEACVTDKDNKVVVTKQNSGGGRIRRGSTKHRIESSDDDKDRENEAGQSLATKQVTKMFFLITLVFVISFIPHLIVLIIIVIRKDYLENMSPTTIVFYALFLRSFVINNMANPLIYAWCDKRFRSECKDAVMNVVTCGRYLDS